MSYLEFMEDILELEIISSLTAHHVSHKYFTALRNFLDKHTPVKRKDIPKHPHTVLMNVDILAAKRFKRKSFNFLLEQARGSHFSRIMAENERKQKSFG